MPRIRKPIKLLISKHWGIAISLTIIFLVMLVGFRRFIFTPEWPAGGDILSHISRQYIEKDSRWLFVWRDQSFGYNEGINLMDFFFALLSFGGNAPATAKIFALLSYLIAGFAMYAFGYHFTRKNVAALAGSLLYILNPWILTQLTEAHLDILFGYALAPAIFLFFDKAFTTRSTKDILISSFLFAIMLTSFHPESIAIYACFLGLFAIINIVSPRGLTSFCEHVKNSLKMLTKVGALSLGLSAFVWIPLLFSVRATYLSGGYGFAFEETYTFGYSSFIEALTLGGKESGGYVMIVDVIRNVGLQILPVTFILLLILAVSYAVTLVLKMDRYSLYFGLSALASILISMGPYSPFGSSFSWAWFNIPFVDAFRVTSRWAMMTAISNSFFVCTSVNIAAGYLSGVLQRAQKDLRIRETPAKNGSSSFSKKVLKIPDGTASRIRSRVRKFLRYAIILYVITTLLIGFFSTWFFISHGLEVYTPPQSYIEPFEYLGKIPEDYKIVTISRSGSDWYSVSGNDTNFGYHDMLTPIGWSHDLGSDSSFIDDKPVLQNGGWLEPSVDFVNYLTSYLAGNNVTRNILKMLGTFNYKYVVIPSYVTENVRNLFLIQNGGRIIYNESNSIILENDFYTPRMSSPTQFALVFGGIGSLASLYDIESFNLNETAVILSNQAENFASVASHFLDDCSAMVFTEPDAPYLNLASSEDSSLIYAANYGVNSDNATRYWIRSNSWSDFGETVLGGETLQTCGNNVMNLPFDAKSNGDYEVWIRIGFDQNRGKLLLSIDGLPIAEIEPKSIAPQLRWIEVSLNCTLEAGSHIISLTNDGTGYNDVDAIAVLEQDQAQYLMKEILDVFQNFKGKILCMADAEDLFYDGLPANWVLGKKNGEDYYLHLENGPSAAVTANVSASSDDGINLAQYATDGDYSTRWASSSGLPQWLELSWPNPQKFLGVTINFERAVARDYSIQAWNGTDWNDLIIEKGNTMLERSYTFSQLVTTTKLRLYVTSAPAFNMVSVFEFGAHSLNTTVTSTVFVPRNGEYEFAARLTSEKTNSTLYAKVDENLFSCTPLNESDFAWQQLGPIYLDAGEHNVSMNAIGAIDLDKISLYSAESNISSLDRFFESESVTPSLAYEKISPCQYVVHVNCTKPFLLVFSESYHPLWKAYVGGLEVSPIVVDCLANGFFINKTGSFDITLFFTGQTYADVGLAISGGCLILIVMAVCMKSLPFRRLLSRLKNRIYKRS